MLSGVLNGHYKKNSKNQKSDNGVFVKYGGKTKVAAIYNKCNDNCTNTYIEYPLLKSEEVDKNPSRMEIYNKENKIISSTDYIYCQNEKETTAAILEEYNNEDKIEITYTFSDKERKIFTIKIDKNGKVKEIKNAKNYKLVNDFIKGRMEKIEQKDEMFWPFLVHSSIIAEILKGNMGVFNEKAKQKIDKLLFLDCFRLNIEVKKYNEEEKKKKRTRQNTHR